MEINIALLPGDGIGPEVIAQGKKVISAIAEKFRHNIKFTSGLIGASAINETGDPFPDVTFQICKNADAVLFGAIGDPKYDLDPKAPIRPEQGLLAMRKKLGLYANVRPVSAFDALVDKSPLRPDLVRGVNFVVVRELTGGIYFGEPRGRSENGSVAFDTNIYSRMEVERIVRLAIEYAKSRNRCLTVVDKANVLETSRLWREVSRELEKEYMDIRFNYLFVDNAAMQIIQNPRQFDVIVTENMFGDILTDEACVITGSLGMLPSASIGQLTSVFEPIHGSFPQAAGKNIANPIATILSTAMMFDYAFHLKKESLLISSAVEASINKDFVTVDIAKGKSRKTTEVGDWIAEFILQS